MSRRWVLQIAASVTVAVAAQFFGSGFPRTLFVAGLLLAAWAVLEFLAPVARSIRALRDTFITLRVVRQSSDDYERFTRGVTTDPKLAPVDSMTLQSSVASLERCVAETRGELENLVADVSAFNRNRARRALGGSLVMAVPAFIAVNTGVAAMCYSSWIASAARGDASFHVPATSITFSDFLYFAIVTMQTIGYGDIAPRTFVAQLLAMATSVFGWIFLGVTGGALLSLLLSDEFSQTLLPLPRGEQEANDARRTRIAAIVFERFQLLASVGRVVDNISRRAQDRGA